MLKVLIADDERIVRKTLRLIGNWDKYEMELVGEAQNGIEVLEMIERLTPDILLLGHEDARTFRESDIGATHRKK